ncbi:Uncharacterised protein [Vibrio cholerae]|nr:Uncharacterised protein [Vibrio cholerae]
MLGHERRLFSLWLPLPQRAYLRCASWCMNRRTLYRPYNRRAFCRLQVPCKPELFLLSCVQQDRQTG